MKGQFEKYVNLIRNISWKVAKKYGVEYEEVEAQGFLIYCEILNSYDISKAGFSTYLYIQLNGNLEYFAKKQKKVCCFENGTVLNENYEVDNFLISCESREYDLNNNDLVVKACETLDADSFKVFEFLISFKWLAFNRCKPTVSDVMREFKLSRESAKVLWNNCRDFWLNVA